MEEEKQKTVFDTNKQQLGDVYAKALLAFGQKSGKLDSLMDELDGVVGAVNALPKFKAALESPSISAEGKASMIDKAFGGKVSKEMSNFLKIVGNKGRFDCLSTVLGSAKKMHDEMVGRVEASVTTAEAIEDSVRQKISDQLAKALGKKVNLSTVVDPKIIGGMIVRVGDTVYDSSVTRQLAQVRSQAVKRASDAIRTSIDSFTSS